MFKRFKRITFAVCRTEADHVIVNASWEGDAYQAVYGEPFPEDEDLLPEEWECCMITLNVGEVESLSHY